MLLLPINHRYLFSYTLKTLRNIIKCSLLSQFYILLQLFKFMFDICDKAILVRCYCGNHGLSEITAF